MMKSRLYLRNSARAARNSLATIIISAFLFAGCDTPQAQPTYSIENLRPALEKILKDEYQITVVAKLVGQTLWVYMPLREAIFINSDKPEEANRKFKIDLADPNNPLEPILGSYQDGQFSLYYNIKEIPDAKETYSQKFNPDVLDKINKVWRAVRRVLFSLEHHKYAPRFFVTVATEVKPPDPKKPNELVELVNISYIDDFKKASYEMISWVEYLHRTIEQIQYAPEEALEDYWGFHLRFYDVGFRKFLIDQIKQRLRYKFNRPEVARGVNIDKEVLKTARQVFEIYKVKDFIELELNNIATASKTSLSRAKVLEETKE